MSLICFVSSKHDCKIVHKKLRIYTYLYKKVLNFLIF